MSARILVGGFLFVILSAVLPAADVFPDRITYLRDRDGLSLDFVAHAVGDFDGDGVPDVGGPLRYSELGVLLQDRASGTWRGQKYYADDTDTDYGSAGAGDLDGDGIDDLAAANPGILWVLLGSRTGTLKALPGRNGAGQPENIGLADLDGDGVLDVFGTLPDYARPSGPPGLAVLHGNGDGTFADPVAVDLTAAEAAPLTGLRSAAADVDGDGKPDLVAIGTDGARTRVSALTRSKAGPFAEVFSAWVDGVGSALRAADLDGDGRVDLAVAVAPPDSSLGVPGATVFLFEGAPDIGFWNVNSLALRGPAAGITSGVVKAGSLPGLFVTDAAGVLSVWRQGKPTRFDLVQEAAGGPYPMTLRDMDGDGKADLVLGGGDGPPGILLVRGRGDGTFRSPPAVDELSGSVPSAAGDLDRDGFPDLVTVQNAFPPYRPSNFGAVLEVTAYRGDGKGGLRHSFTGSYDVGDLQSAYDARLGDLDGDGSLDLVVRGLCQDWTTRVQWLRGNGDGSFGAPRPWVGDVASFDVRDVDGDGRAEVIAVTGARDDAPDSDRKILVLKAGKDGALETAATYAQGLGPRGLGIADFDGDGHDDLVLFGREDPGLPWGLLVLPGRGDGTFGPPRWSEPRDQTPLPFAPGDWNGDGRIDLVSPYGWAAGRGDGTFEAFRPLEPDPWQPFGPSGVEFALADVDGDGRLDMVAGVDSLRVLFNDGAGGIASVLAAAGHGASYYGPRVLISDLDRDGSPDVISVSSAIVVYRNSGPGATFIRGDVNGDAKVDLTDAIALLGCLFRSARCPSCERAADANGDGKADLSDAVSTISYLFLGGSAPRAPFPACGVDPTATRPCPEHPACKG